MENPVDKLLEKIRLNSVYLTNKHINNHLYYRHSEKWFEIPTIIYPFLLVRLVLGQIHTLNKKTLA